MQQQNQEKLCIIIKPTIVQTKLISTSLYKAQQAIISFSIHNMVDKYIKLFISTLAQVLGYIPALIYGYVYSEFFTKVTYKTIGQRALKASKPVKKVLDIGTATGHPLKSIIHCFDNAEVLGVDINSSYVPACQKLFEENKNVKIQHMNFYDLQKNHPNEKFDIIIFGSSFMLMPDQVKAIQIAKKTLTAGGKIYFLLTLYENRSGFTSFMEVVKPYLKYLTTVDFGKATYKDEFQSFLKDQKLKATNERCSGNFFLKVAKFYIYEAQVQSN